MALNLETDYYRQQKYIIQTVLGVCVTLVIITMGCLFMLLKTVHADSINSTDFVTTWSTNANGDVSEDPTSITIPMAAFGTDGGYDVDWDNDGVFDQTNLTNKTTHDYGVSGTYTVRIKPSSTTTSLELDMGFNSTADNQKKLTSIDQWGTIHWSSMVYAFYGTTNMELNATDIPDLSGVTSVAGMFSYASKITGSSMNSWDTSNVTNMSGMFGAATSFNGDISNWDTSNVTNMSGMFGAATSFNGDISNWNTSNLMYTGSMFANATAFNRDLSGWNMANVTNMNDMFNFATSFNSDISSWDIHNAIDTSAMFANATSFNRNLSSWDTSNVTNMNGMFYNAPAFNSNLSSWDTSKVTNMGYMFRDATSFDQNLSSFDMSSVTNVGNMLSGSGLSSLNYEATLTGWSTQDLNSGLTLDANGLEYCTASASRQSIIDNFSWTINGDVKGCQIYLNGGNTASVQAGSPIGTDVGSLTVTNFTLRATSPYTLTCATPGADDSSFVVGGSSGDQLLVNRVFDHDAPADANADNVYEVCVKATDVNGYSIDQIMMITVTPIPAEKLITGVSFSEDSGKKILTVHGTGLVADDGGVEASQAVSRSMVSLNGEPLKMCAGGTLLSILQSDPDTYDPQFYTENSPCYFLYDFDVTTLMLTPTQAQIWLPDGFDVAAEGTVSVNGSNTYTFNATSGPIVPTVNVNGNGSIDQMPTIPKRPTFSGIAEPGSTITVTVHSDPVVCTATADFSGNWSCTLPSDLAPGIHTVTVVVISPDGLTSTTLGPYSVTVGGTITNNTPLAPNTGFLQLVQQYKTNKQREPLLWAVLVGVSLISVFASAVFMVQKKKSRITFSHKI
jgi:surface protein